MLAEKLDRLVDAFEEHGIPVASNLRPGATDDQLDEMARRLSVDLPDDLRLLYRWRNGHFDPDADNVLRFRDNKFLRLEDMPEIRSSVIGVYESPDPGELSLGADLEDCVPIAQHMGSTFLVVCGDHSFGDRSHYPVLSAFHGVDLFFYSIESMVDTCIEWVEQVDYDPHREEHDEIEIWKRHNPGIF